MHFKQFGSTLILILILLGVMTESILTILTVLRNQQIALNSFKMGIQNKMNMNSALMSIERSSTGIKKSGHLQYQHHDYEYSVLPVTPSIFRVTICEGEGLRMQTTVEFGKRLSWQLL